MSYHVLGAVCGECQISAGDQCLPCPDGAEDFVECQGCVNGSRPQKAWHEGFWGIAVTGIVSSVIVAVASTVIVNRVHKKS